MKKQKSFTGYEAVNNFEEAIADFCGSKYAIAVDSCTNALFLCLTYKRLHEVHASGVCIPTKTYPSVACAIKNANMRVSFLDKSWKGSYELYPFKVIDSALRFKKDMHKKGDMTCLSFHMKKHIPIGRGGMILVDELEMYEWLKKARFDGRNPVPLNEDKIEMIGWNCYMTPEQASRGLVLFNSIKDDDIKDLQVSKQNYPDLSKLGVYQ